jgi:hypothetical protein
MNSREEETMMSRGGASFTDAQEASFTDAQDDARDELVGYLERDQLEVEMDKHLPLARLSRWSRLGLWALRVFVVAVGAMVIYTFVAGLH